MDFDLNKTDQTLLKSSGLISTQEIKEESPKLKYEQEIPLKDRTLLEWKNVDFFVPCKDPALMTETDR